MEKASCSQETLGYKMFGSDTTLWMTCKKIWSTDIKNHSKTKTLDVNPFKPLLHPEAPATSNGPFGEPSAELQGPDMVGMT